MQNKEVYLQATHKDKYLDAVFHSDPEVLKQVLKDKDAFYKQKDGICKAMDKWERLSHS